MPKVQIFFFSVWMCNSYKRDLCHRCKLQLILRNDKGFYIKQYNLSEVTWVVNSKEQLRR